MRGSAFHAGFFIALALVVVYWLWDRWTALGYETRLAGLNARFATASA